MDFLSQRQHGPPQDDVEAQGASHSNGATYPAGTPGHTGDFLGDSSGQASSGATAAGDHIKFGEYRMKQPAKSSDLNEYEALDRFITNFDQERRASLASGLSKKKAPVKWWQFWKPMDADPDDGLSAADIGKPPEAWLETDIHHGLTSAQVDERRRRYGWNELTAEQENMFAKILSYFQGPILYGKFMGRYPLVAAE